MEEARKNRFTDKEDLSPVLRAAYGYLGQPYGSKNLYTVALMTLYRHYIEPTGIFGDVAFAIVELMTAVLTHYVNKGAESSGQMPMVCSQFIFQSFMDVPGYRLDIPVLEPWDVTKSNEDPKPLLDQVVEDIQTNGYKEDPTHLQTSSWGKMLVEAFLKESRN